MFMKNRVTKKNKKEPKKSKSEKNITIIKN